MVETNINANWQYKYATSSSLLLLHQIHNRCTIMILRQRHYGFITQTKLHQYFEGGTGTCICSVDGSKTDHRTQDKL